MLPIKFDNRAFTLLEILIVVVIIGILAALVVPQMSGAAESAKVSKVLQVVDVCRTAAEAHYAHTGMTAREFSDSTSDADRQLSIKQASVGWKGPYIGHPLAASDNPFGGVVRVYDDFDSGSVHPGGFDLTGRGSDTSTGRGQYIAFTNIDEIHGKAIDDAIDGGIEGNWKNTGRVEWAKNTVMVFIADMPE